MPEQLQSRERQRTLWDLLRNGAGSNRPTDTSNPTSLQSVVSHHRDLKPVGLTVSRDLSFRRRQSHGRFRFWVWRSCVSRFQPAPLFGRSNKAHKMSQIKLDARKNLLGSFTEPTPRKRLT